MSADTLCWTDIPVTNLDRAIKFYSAILGKQLRKLSGGGMEYGLLPHEEQNASGCLCIRGQSGRVDHTPSANGHLIYHSGVGRLHSAADAAKPQKSLAVLAKIKEVEFQSRSNIEKLAELSLTIEEELKQKTFAEPIEEVYSAQEAFHSKVSTLIEAYQKECDRLKPAAG